MTKESFERKKDELGREYVQIKYNEYDKNHPGSETKEQVMFEKKDDPLCTIISFDIYMSKLNPKCETLLGQGRVV